MLWSLEHLRSYRLRATDGTLGSVEDVFFDDQTWTVRYLVADTAWLIGRRVLISPQSLGHPDAAAGELPVQLTKEQIRTSPEADADMPVSRRHELELHRYYGWTPYWGAGGWGPAIPPGATGVPGTPQEARISGADPLAEAALAEAESAGDPHLRSARELESYHIHATDGSIGHVQDFLVDEDGWVVRYLVVDTRNWLPGRKVILAPAWVRDIDWEAREVAVTVTKEEVRSSPEYRPGEAVGRGYESELYRHYQRDDTYWI